jgi:hypothetical protein
MFSFAKGSLGHIKMETLLYINSCALTILGSLYKTELLGCGEIAQNSVKYSKVMELLLRKQ